MIKAVIFDLDGTLANTVESMAYSANLVLEELGLPSLEAERFRYYAGDGVEELVRRCLRDAGDAECSRFELFLERYRVHFSKYCMYQVRPYEGIPELLETLRERGIRTAVLSNKPHAQAVEVVETLFWKGCFDSIQGQTQKIPRKPSPLGALALADRLGVRPEECLYVGDTNTDMQTGKRARMHPVGVLWGFREREELEENGSEFVVAFPAELVRLLSI